MTDAASVGAASGTATQYIVDVVLRCAASDAAGSGSTKYAKPKPCPAGQEGEMLVRLGHFFCQIGRTHCT
jgi:hypothetical protein